VIPRSFKVLEMQGFMDRRNTTPTLCNYETRIWKVNVNAFTKLPQYGTEVSSFTLRPTLTSSTAVRVTPISEHKNLTFLRFVDRASRYIRVMKTDFMDCLCLQVLLYQTAALVLYNFTLMFLYRCICFACWTLLNFMFCWPCVSIHTCNEHRLHQAGFHYTYVSKCTVNRT
jgi:hypothetical protein